jgi:hypothetical protein
MKTTVRLDLMEKIQWQFLAGRIQLDRKSQSYTIPIPFVFVSCETKKPSLAVLKN